MAADADSGFAQSPETVAAGLRQVGYLAGEGLAIAIFLALRMGKPLLLEGAPGVGKTEAAKAVAAALRRELVRLQCYEGIDAGHALYEWNYQRQLLAIRREGDGEADIYGDAFLIDRPLLKVLRASRETLLVIDEVDRSDHEFEALLLEFLSDFQISIPERGTIAAATPPLVFLTSNRTRELSEALRRRCVYHFIDYPDVGTEAAIIGLRAPDVAHEAALAVAKAMQEIRRRPLAKPPGISEAVEWAGAAALFERSGADLPVALVRAAGLVLKSEEDRAFLGEDFAAIVQKAAGQ